MVVDANSSLMLQGAIDNTGTIALEGYYRYTNGYGGAVPASILVDGSVTLQGGGQIALWDGARYAQYYGDTTIIYQGPNSIVSSGTPATLINVDNTIIGGGQIGDADLTLVNQAGGVIEAAAVGDNPNPNQPIRLTLDTGSNTIVNAGLIEATAGTTLQINSAVTNTGIIEAIGGFVEIENRLDNSGGTITSDVAGTLHIAGTGSLIGDGVISGVLRNDGVIEASGGTLEIKGAVSGTGTVEIALNSTLELGNAFSGSIHFTTDDVETLIIDDLPDFHGTIDVSQASGALAFSNETIVSAVVSNGILDIKTADEHGYALNIVGAQDGNYIPETDNAGGTDLVICFYAGTRLLTPCGEKTVETLMVGDLVTTSDGLLKPVSWIGRQTVSTAFADPLRVLPIRIRAGVLNDHVPSRDLLLSPDHAILVGDVLVQAGALVNAASIIREANVPGTFTYYHVEIDDHSLVLAENTPAETFVDNVDRLNFDNWAEHETLYPGGKSIIELPYPRAKAHRQVPRSIREQLAERSAAFCGAVSSVA